MTQPDLDRLLDDFGDRLVHAAPPRRRAPVLAGAGAALAAVALALVLLLSGAPASRPADAVAKARAALDPAGAVLHVRLVTFANQGRTRFASEQWSAHDPQRLHVVSSKDGKRVAEFASAGTTLTSYLPGRRELQVDLDVNPDPGLSGPLGADPVVRIRELLADGSLRDTGLRTVGGREVRRLAGRPRRPGNASYAFDVDPDSFVPVRFTETLDGPPWRTRATRRPAIVLVTEVERYERLPLTARSARLLEIQPPRGTQVVRRTRADREQIDRERRRHVRCGPVHEHGMRFCRPR